MTLLAKTEVSHFFKGYVTLLEGTEMSRFLKDKRHFLKNRSVTFFGGYMYDTHVHSTFSPDGKSSVEEYSHIIDKGIVKGLGFTEHLDFLPECGAYEYLDYDLYSNTINKYREIGYEFYKGAEIDYSNSVESDIARKLKNQQYDYTICSVHMIDGIPVSDKRGLEYFNDFDTFRFIIEKYYKEIELSLNLEDVDIIGHIGIYKRYLEKDFLDNHKFNNDIKELDYQLAKKCALSDKIIEVNSSGLFADFKSSIPDFEFLKTYYDFGGRKVSMGSDAHCAANTGRGLEIVKEMLKKIGLAYTILPWNKKERRI